MKRWLPLVLLLITHVAALEASDKVKGNDLLERADAKSNLLGLPSFEMKASVRVDNNGHFIEGSYTFLWNGPEQWREEISFPGYKDVNIGGKGVGFQKRSTDFMPLEMFRLQGALNYGRHLKPGPKETANEVHGRKVNGIKVDCVEIADQTNYKREICVDVSTDALVRQSPFIDRDLMTVGSKLFPRYLSYVEHGKTLAEVQITELEITDPAPTSAFVPPEGAVSKPSCINPDQGRVVRRVNPEYPGIARMAHKEGTVAIYAIIGVNGVLRNLRVVSAENPVLDQASLYAVRQWRYEPYTCNAVPIEVESTVFVTFSLHH